MRAFWLLPLLAACAGGGGGSVATLGCGGDVRLRNVGGMTVEQAYFSPAGSSGWGPDLLAPGTLPPGGSQVVRAAPGRNAVRIIFANGRAAEMPAMDVCATPSLNIEPTGLLASR
ncbi:hypothetical protein [Sediminicoccus sp. KRV36]|uniref:hypothetical protein n=1 Tax=Sediminicoccus sp. KRV36 TaxID=3133721 RepID=UPI00200FE6E5|nr:hypothetical protein [Sediminicoccus rosea]UPY37878.1 hypothetical protein LHU95_04060 [Sediminicoccus rosea]